ESADVSIDTTQVAPAANPVINQTSSFALPSKTVLTVKKLEEARERRREAAAKMRKAEENVGEEEKEAAFYKEQIRLFQQQLGVRTKSESPSSQSQNLRIRVCPKIALDRSKRLDTHKLGNDGRGKLRKRTILASFFEIYGSKVFDLLSLDCGSVQMLEDRSGTVRMPNLKEVPVPDLARMLELVDLGRAARKTGTTRANASSSRSHAVFQLKLVADAERGGSPRGAGDGGGGHGVLSLVDLAGSERAADAADAGKKTRTEGASINRSLLALKECIRALHRLDAQGSGVRGTAADHVPFRGSKLTQLLRDSFVGQGSQTVMISTINPGCRAVENTLNTLRYASRVKDFQAGKEKGGETHSARESLTGAEPAVAALEAASGSFTDGSISETSDDRHDSSRKMRYASDSEESLSDRESIDWLFNPDSADGPAEIAKAHRESLRRRRQLLELEEDALCALSDGGSIQTYKRGVQRILRKQLELGVDLMDGLKSDRSSLQEGEERRNPFGTAGTWDSTKK
ncbi:Kinesin-like protein kif2a, partial [Cladochytrium tenue]